MAATLHIESQTIEHRLGRSVSIDQAALLLNVSRRTIYNRIRDGRLQTMRTLGGSQRVLIESIYELGARPQVIPSSDTPAASYAERALTGN
jgi:excisionase family DNA binding protein